MTRIFLDSSVLFSATYSIHGHFEFVRPMKRDVLAATKHVALKDAPIVAAARKAKVDFLVTLDRKHLLGQPNLAKYVRAPIVTPKEVMEQLSSKN